MTIRGTVKASDTSTTCQEVQIELMAGEVRDDVPLYEQAGVSFRAEDDAEVLVESIDGMDGNLAAFLSAARGKRPNDTIEKGEGGLYYAGVFRVFLKADGTVLLGTKDATDFVALASKVLTELNDIRTKFDLHVHTSAAPASPTTVPTVLIGAASSVAATKVKAV